MQAQQNFQPASSPTPRSGKIAVEEHFLTPLHEEYVSRAWMAPAARARMIERLSEVDEGRLAEMDAAGIERAILSLASEGIQSEVEPERAIAQASAANDALAEIVARHPRRYAGLAAVALQRPLAAAEELERAVRELGFCGVCVNGYSNAGSADVGVYYDDRCFDPFWERVQQLGVPLYLHPRYPLPAQRSIYEGRLELLGSTWGFGVETATHALRLITSGLFDRFPGVQIVLGHLGELLPFAMHRMEGRMKMLLGSQLRRPVGAYLRENFYVSTSGNFHTQSLIGCLLELGADRLLFAVDHPFEAMAQAASWFDGVPVSDADWLKIARTNAERLFGL